MQESPHRVKAAEEPAKVEPAPAAKAKRPEHTKVLKKLNALDDDDQPELSAKNTTMKESSQIYGDEDDN